MQFSALPMSIEDALTLNRKYIIPRFQREYSWESDELSEMWEDLVDSMFCENGSVKASEYFIGSLVLVGDDKSDNPERFVVDGQQRLTTFTIAFAVIVQLLLKEGENILADSIHKYIIGSDNDGNSFTRMITETPKPFFQYRIQEKEINFNVAPQTSEEKRILDAYHFFEKRLSKLDYLKYLSSIIKGISDSFTYIDALKAFRDQILKCKVVYVTVASFADAYTIFEVLNAKGKDLTPVDIIKNTIFSVLTQQDPIDFAVDKWQRTRNLIERTGEQDFVNFYRHYWLSNYSFATYKKLRKEFEDKIPSTVDSYKNFLNDLERSADLYSKIILPDRQDWKQIEYQIVFEVLDALSLFNTTQVRTFLLALLDTREKNIISHRDFLRTLRYLEKYHFIFTAVCSSRASGLERRYSSYARTLRECKDKLESRICVDNLIRALQGTIPEQVVFVQKFLKISYTSSQTKDKKLVQYILKRFEWYLANTNELQPNSFTIEHIIPESTRTDYCGMIGNLLPLGEDLNCSLKDKPLSQKIETYRQSRYASVHDFLETVNDGKWDEWNKDNIIERTKYIADTLYTLEWKYD